jgi:hypothetical protein
VKTERDDFPVVHVRTPSWVKEKDGLVFHRTEAVTVDGVTRRPSDYARPILDVLNPSPENDRRSWYFNDGPPIREDVWLYEGLIVDENGCEYSRQGEPIQRRQVR